MIKSDTPRYIGYLSLDQLSVEQFIVLANDVILHLGLHINYINNNGLIAQTYNSYADSGSLISIKVENSEAIIQSESIGDELFDMGRNKEYVTAFIEHFYKLRSACDTEDLEGKYQLLKNHTFCPEVTIEILPLSATGNKVRGYLSFAVPQKGFFVTPVLVHLNILLFIVMVISGVDLLLPDTESLLEWGANFRAYTLEGEWWRLISSLFLHIGIDHLIINMFALVYIGLLLEPILGKLRFMVAYILSGIVASLTSLCWHSFTVSAGASGAIFGMYGVLIAFLTTSIVDRTARKGLLLSMLTFVGYSLLGGLKDGIDNAAHIGGLIGGLLVGYAFVPSLENNGNKRILSGTIAILSFFVLVASLTIYKKLPNTALIYETNMKRFFAQEQMALEVYRMRPNTKKELLHEIRTRVIYYWNENIDIIHELEQLDLPDLLQERNKQLLLYCKLRIEHYESVYNAISEDKLDQKKSQLEKQAKEIEDKITEIKRLYY